MIGADELLGIVARGRSLSRSAQVLWMLAAFEASEGRPFPSVPTLAGVLGLAERRVYDLLAELVACGELVEVERGAWKLP
jgi:DNA-binding IclR family transcriptional regulator